MLLDDFYIAIDELNLNDSKLNEERNKLKKGANVQRRYKYFVFR